jgi:hypothetical protein
MLAVTWVQLLKHSPHTLKYCRNMFLSFKPAATVSYPPAEHDERKSEGEAPKDRRGEVKQETERNEQEPENFALHEEAPGEEDLFPAPERDAVISGL